MLLELNGTMKIESLELIYDFFFFFFSLLNECQWQHRSVKVLIKADMYTLRTQKHLPRAKYSLELPHKCNSCTNLTCFKPVNSKYAEISFLEWKEVIAHCACSHT